MKENPDTQDTSGCPDGCPCYRHRRKVHIVSPRRLTATTWAVGFVDKDDRILGPLIGESVDLNSVVELLERIRDTNPDAACIALRTTTTAEFVPNDALYGL